MKLTHLNASGEAHMVDVSAKPDTRRTAEARAIVLMNEVAYNAILHGDLKKGDALGVARLAGIMAAKRASDLIPLCHPVALTHVEVSCEPRDGRIIIHARAESIGKTGVEMEAMTAANIAALTVYDMAKGIDRGMVISEVRLLSKSGGKSGEWRADPNDR